MRSLRMQTSVIFLLTLCSLDVVSGRLSPKQSLIWGSGLRPDFVVPVRFFFIQAVDEQGQNFTESAGEDAFQVAMYQNDGARARVWSQVLDRHDGSYIARFKMMQSYRDMKIEVLHNGKPVAQSPYVLEGLSYHEKCYCPVASLDEWLDTMQCRQNYDQIDNDLASFPDNIDMVAVTEEAVARFNQRGAHSLCHFVIKDNQVYRQTHGQHVGFKMFMDSVLLSMTRKMRLPDMEFIVNLGDWPLVLKKKKGGDKPIPIFSWCGSDESFDIIMPTYDVTESTLETMGRCDNDTDRQVIDSLEMPTYEADDTKLQSACRVSLDLLSVQANTGPKWENKSSLAFWRGRDSRRERLDLVRLSRKHPDIIDAKLTNMFFFKHEEDLGEIVKHVSFFDFFKHKYQINLDGTVAAYRTPYLMAGTSVVLKQESPYYEHFYKELEPFKHYIPIKRDISDVLEKIQWAKDHDDEAKQIALNAQEYVRNNLMADDVFCYHAVLFREFTKKVISKPEVREGMELVEQPSEHPPCYCERLKRKDEL